jgi:hypothetical protein
LVGGSIPPEVTIPEMAFGPPSSYRAQSRETTQLFPSRNVCQPLPPRVGLDRQIREEMQETPQGRGPSDATRARRQAKILLAPYVANLSSWHQQAARLLLEVDRAESLGQPDAIPAEAVQQLIKTIERERSAFVSKTASLVSSRVEDVERSFTRLLSDLQQAEARCNNLGNATR